MSETRPKYYITCKCMHGSVLDTETVYMDLTDEQRGSVSNMYKQLATNMLNYGPQGLIIYYNEDEDIKTKAILNIVSMETNIIIPNEPKEQDNGIDYA